MIMAALDLDSIFAELATDAHDFRDGHACHDACDCWMHSSGALGQTLFEQVQSISRDIGSDAPIVDIDVADVAALTGYNTHYSIADMILTYVYRSRSDLLAIDSTHFCTYISDTIVFPPPKDLLLATERCEEDGDVERELNRCILTETEQEILFKVVTGDDISIEESVVIDKSPLIGHSNEERALKHKIVGGEDFTRSDVRTARDLIRNRHIVRDLETIRKNIDRKLWSERSRRIRDKNIRAYQFRTRRTVERRNEPGRLDFRGSGLFFRLVGSVHGVVCIVDKARGTSAARAVEIRNRREIFGITPNHDLVPALVHAMMLCCESVDLVQCAFNDGKTAVKVSTLSVSKFHNLLEVIKARLFQVVAIVKELRDDHDLRAKFLHMDPLEKNIFLHQRMNWV